MDLIRSMFLVIDVVYCFSGIRLMFGGFLVEAG